MESPLPDISGQHGMRIRALLAGLQRLLHIRQLGGPVEMALLSPRRRGAVGRAAGLLRRVLGVQVSPGPVVRQGAGVLHRAGLDVGPHGNVQVIQLDAGVPVAGEVGDEADGETGGRGDGVGGLGVLAAEGDGDAAPAAGGGLQGAADGAGREVVDGGGVAAVVGARDHQVDGAAVREEIEQPELHAAGGRAVADDDPVVLGVGVGVAGCLIPGRVVAEGGGRHIGGFQGGFDQMRLADPRAGGGGDGDGDEVAGVLEGLDEWLDVGGESATRRTVIVDHL